MCAKLPACLSACLPPCLPACLLAPPARLSNLVIHWLTEDLCIFVNNINLPIPFPLSHHPSLSYPPFLPPSDPPSFTFFIPPFHIPSLPLTIPPSLSPSLAPSHLPYSTPPLLLISPLPLTIPLFLLLICLFILYNTAVGDVPTARSGHRMVVWRNYIVLFGGFYEALREVMYAVPYCAVLYCTVLYCTALYCTVLYCTVHSLLQSLSSTNLFSFFKFEFSFEFSFLQVRWYNDAYVYSFAEERWTNIPYKIHSQVRSSIILLKSIFIVAFKNELVID